MTAGAVLSGGYFGDRFSPVSSSANLTAFITKTEVYDNMKKMARTMIVPLMITIGMYAVLSMKNPLGTVDPAIDRLMLENFTFSPLLLIPVLVMIVLPLFHIKVRVVALISTAIAAVMAVAIQGEDPLVLMKTLLLGYDPEGAELAAIFAGGDALSPPAPFPPGHAGGRAGKNAVFHPLAQKTKQKSIHLIFHVFHSPSRYSFV